VKWRKITAIKRDKVIQGHQLRYQSKASSMRFPDSYVNVCSLSSAVRLSNVGHYPPPGYDSAPLLSRSAEYSWLDKCPCEECSQFDRRTDRHYRSKGLA